MPPNSTVEKIKITTGQLSKHNRTQFLIIWPVAKKVEEIKICKYNENVLNISSSTHLLIMQYSITAVLFSLLKTEYIENNKYKAYEYNTEQ